MQAEMAAGYEIAVKAREAELLPVYRQVSPMSPPHGPTTAVHWSAPHRLCSTMLNWSIQKVTSISNYTALLW